jgi:hypothetical protein
MHRIERSDELRSQPALRGRRGETGLGEVCGNGLSTSRDAAALHGAVRLVRLAVYDDVGEVTLGRALDRADLLDRDALHSLITDRTLAV